MLTSKNTPNVDYRLFNETGFTASYNESIAELQRGVRTHFVKIMKSKLDFLF